MARPSWLRQDRGRRSAGFTLIELLVVMIILGILASVAVVFFHRARLQAQRARVASEIRVINQAARAAQGEMGVDAMFLATGTRWTASPCNARGVLKDLPRTDVCWTRYTETLDVLAAKSGISLDALRNGDPWGAPYLIDENEGEPLGGNCLRRDIIVSAGPNGIQEANGDDILVFLTRGKATPDC